MTGMDLKFPPGRNVSLMEPLIRVHCVSRIPSMLGIFHRLQRHAVGLGDDRLQHLLLVREVPARVAGDDHEEARALHLLRQAVEHGFVFFVATW